MTQNVQVFETTCLFPKRVLRLCVKTFDILSSSETEGLPVRRFPGLFLLLEYVLAAGIACVLWTDTALGIGGEPLGFLFAKEELPTVQDVKETFCEIYGGDPAEWPKEFRRIHHIEVSWSQRALDSENFRDAFEEGERKRRRLQINKPADYWAWALWSGSAPASEGQSEHLAARDVPKTMLARFLEEVFPLMWRDMNSTTHRKKIMLEMDDAGFAPDFTVDPETERKEKKDVLAYNGLLAEATEKYAQAKDLPMLGLLLGRADVCRPGDPEFRSQLMRQKERIDGRIIEVFEAERKKLFGMIFRNLEPFHRYWVERDGTERYVRLEPYGKGTAEKTGTTFHLGTSIRLRQKDPWKSGGSDAPLVKEAPALSVRWRPFPFNGLLCDERAEPLARSEKCLLVRMAESGKRMTLVLFPGCVPQAGYGLEIGSVESMEMTEEVFHELARRVEKAFVLAVEEYFGRSFPRKQAMRKDTGPDRADRVLSLDVSGCGNAEVGAGERMSCRIDIRLTEGGAPVGGAELAVERPRLGFLFSPRVTGGDENTLYIDTDPQGRSVIFFHVPQAAEIQSFPGDLVKLAVRDDVAGLREVVGFRIPERENIEMEVEHDFIPGEDSFPNRIRFRFFGNPAAEGDACNVVIRSKSGLGLFRSGDNGWKASPLILEAEPGAWQSVLYQWNGPSSRDMPFHETVIVEIPGINLYNTVDFSVGVMPVLSEVDIGKGEDEHPGSYVPLKVVVSDRLNPEIDMERFLESFGLSPVVEIEPVEFVPFPLDEKDARLLESLMDSVPGVELPKEASTFQPEEWLLAREGGSGWVLAGSHSDFRPDGPPGTMELPGFIPWLWGDYTFRIRLAFERGDGKSAGSFGHTETRVFALRPGEGEKGLQSNGIIPLILLFSAMFPDDQARLVVAKAERLFSEQNPADAAALLGDAFSKRLCIESTSRYVSGAMDRLREMAAAAKGMEHSDPGEEEFLGMTENSGLSFLCHLGGIYMDHLLGLAKEKTTRKDLFAGRSEEEKMFQELLQGFLSGFGDYGLAAVSKKGLNGLSVYDEQGNLLQKCPPTIFSKSRPENRIYDGENAAVIVFRLGETLILDISGSGIPLQAVKILPNGVNRIFCCDGKTGQRITLFGDVVDPTRKGVLYEMP